MNTPVDWVLQSLDEAATVEDVRRVLRQSVRACVGADGATVVLLEGDQCYYVDEDAMSPLWKGQRFPLRACISGWAMLHRRTVEVPDITVDARIPQEAYRPTFVRSLVMVPMRVDDPLGAIGAYWARAHRASPRDIALLERLATAAGTALARMILPVERLAVARPG